jgi:hypothetical protein
MTNTGQPQLAFPTVRALAALTAAALIAGAAAWVALPLAFGHSPAVGHAVLFAVTLVWLAAVIALIPVAWLSPRGVMPTVYGYFIGMGARLVLCLVAANIAVHAFGLPGPPLGLSLGVLYMSLLLVEVVFVARHLCRADHLERQPAGGAAGPGDSRAGNSREVPA